MRGRAACRATGSERLHTILDYGTVPLADILLTEEQLAEPDPAYPLTLAFCEESALVQLIGDVPLEVLYKGDYPYYTSVNPSLVEHFASGARAIARRKPLGPESLVVEAASNDGCQLAEFQKMGARVLGVDPATGPARVANERGIETLCRFFDKSVAAELAARDLYADVLTGNNVLNLVQDIGGFIAAVDQVLAPDGLLVLEVPNFVETVRQTAYDNIFHQNVTYWTPTSLHHLFRPAGLELIDIEVIPTFGGSLRAYFARQGEPSPSVAKMLADDKAQGVDRPEFYEQFAARARAVRDELRGTLLQLHDEGQRIVAYGAAGGMATTLLNFLDLPPGTLEYAVDISHHKHGRYTPGSRLLVRPVETLVEDRPDLALLLAWNFEAAIRSDQTEWLRTGGRFIVPIPSVRVS